MRRLADILISDRLVFTVIILNTDAVEAKVEALAAEIRELRRELERNRKATG